MVVRRWMAGGLLAAGAVAPLALAGGASAHVPTWSVACDRISVELTNYNASFHNSVTVTLDGETLLDHKKFGETFSQDLVVKAHTKDVKAVLTVVTDEDPKGERGWSVTKTETIAPCPTSSPSPSPSPSHSSSSPTPSPSHSATATPTVHPSTSKAPTPSPTGPQLASTGGGSSAPVIAGAGAGVIAIGGGLLFLGRRRQSRRH